MNERTKDGMGGGGEERNNRNICNGKCFSHVTEFCVCLLQFMSIFIISCMIFSTSIFHGMCVCMCVCVCGEARFIFSFICQLSAVAQGRFCLGAYREIASGAPNPTIRASRMSPRKRKLVHLLGTLYFFEIQDTKLKRREKHLIGDNQWGSHTKLLHHGALKSRSGTAVVFAMYSKSGSSSNINNSICFAAFYHSQVYLISLECQQAASMSGLL